MAVTNSISRTVRLCRWRARVNSLWLWAYCVLVLVLQAYLLYRAVTRCKEYNELSWRTNDKPIIELYAYITLIVLSVMCVPFFIISSVFRVNNYAGDGIRLGRDNIHESELAEAASVATLPDPAAQDGHSSPQDDHVEEPEVTQHSSLGSRVRGLWNHIGPFSHGFHVVSAFSLLLPSILLEAQEIKYGFRNPEETWHSELDVLFGRREFKSKPTSKMELKYSSLDTTTTTAEERAISPADFVRTASISPEYVNYILALVVYGVRYATVFWYTKMSFSIVFILQMAIITLHFAFTFCGVGIVYKFQVNSHGFTDMDLILPATATLVLFLLGNTCLLLSSLAIFQYGFQHYLLRWRKFLNTYAPAYMQQRTFTLSCHGYAPHTLATVSLLFVICCRGAIVYDYVIVYRRTGFPVILACIVMDALYMVSWIGLWFALTLKQNWDFRIMFARYVLPQAELKQKSAATPGGKQSANIKPTEGRNAISSSEIQNGQIPTALDAVDGSTGQQPATGPSLLRKDNSRRSMPSQKVKFDRTAEDHGPDDHKTKKSKGSKKGTKNGSVRRAHSDSSKKSNKDADERGIESTPESTLTRGYRHSIRDKCGHFYRISKEPTPPPAAQSSPRIDQKRSNNSPVEDEIMLKPLPADQQYPHDHYIPYTEHLSPYDAMRHQPDNMIRNGQPNYSPEGVPLRYPTNLGRDPGVSRQPDARYSYPLANPGAWGPETYDSVKGSQRYQPTYVQHPAREPRSARHSLQFDRPGALPNVHEGSYLGSSERARADQPSPYSNGDRAATRQKSTSNNSVQEGNRPSTPPRPPKASDHSRAARELRYMSKKPDLSHRDSALPSSNETSSNDSNDVLCSQV